MARQFYFAWANSGEAFSAAHHVFDENVFSLAVGHAEGEFASAQVTLQNPRVGLLNGSRKQWAWISVDTGMSAGVVPLLYGRIVGLPSRLEGEFVDLEFLARPPTYETLKAALAISLKVAPYYDALWIAPDRRDDPDAVLEFYPGRWHIDRATHAVTLSDINAGEDGVLDFTDNVIEGSLDVTVRQTPLRKVQVEAQVSWDQIATGSVDISGKLVEAAAAAGTTTKNAVSSMTGDGLAKDWPAEGDRIGYGWTVGQASVVHMDGTVVTPDYTTVYTPAGNLQLLEVNLRPHLEIDYDVSRRRVERVSFTLDADMQAVLTDPGDDEIMLLTLSSADAGAPIDPATTADPDGTLPIGDTRRRAFLPTDRGRQSLEALIAYARTRLLTRARAVDVRFVVPFDDGLTLSCRHNGRLVHPDLPGGEATGKVTAYELRIDGNTGEALCEITISCTVGEGNMVSAVDGVPDYVEDGYVEDDYQTFTGRLVMPIAGAVTYADYSATQPDDDGIDFFALDADTAIDSLSIINGVDTQKAVLDAFLYDAAAAVEAINKVYTEFDIDLVPLTGGPFETDYAITVSDLMVPKTIDLEAAAA